MTFRGTEKVLESIAEAKSYGYKTLHICFDPYPKKPDYFLDLFSLIRKEGLRTECRFDSFGLPTLDLIKAFKETFPGPHSVMTLSPDVGSERLRRIHKGNGYGNQALMDCLDQFRNYGIAFDLFFTFGVPFEKEEDLHETVRLQRQIRRRYPNLRRIRTSRVGMEPGSPMHQNPESFHVKTALRSFGDYYRYASGKKNPFSSSGYWIPGYFRGVEDESAFEEALQRFKCRHFCFPPLELAGRFSPFWGRRLCDLSHLFWKVKGLVESL